MEQAVEWIAPITTTIAAVMVAANGGARLTGYGFIVFAIGSIAWAAYGLMTGQDSLLIQNVILLGINLFGIWRWLGRAVHYEDGAEAASEAADGGLVAASSLIGKSAEDRTNRTIGSIVDVMLSRHTGRTIYAALSWHGGGFGEKLFAVPWKDIDIGGEKVTVDTDEVRLKSASGIDRDHWPVHASHAWDQPVPQ